MGIMDLLNKFRGVDSEIESLKDTSIRNETITSLVKIKEDLNKADQLGINAHINQHTFRIHDIEHDLKALKIITKKLNENGINAKLGSAEYYMAMIGSRYDADLTIKVTETKSENFKEKLNTFLDNYLQELGVSLDIVNYEMTTKYGPSYKNIINNIKVEPKPEDSIPHPKKIKF